MSGPKYQGLGEQDSAVPMFLGARGSTGQYRSGLTVFLRVIDPPDRAAYMNLPGNTLAHDGDNTGPSATLKILDDQGVPLVRGSTGVYEAVSGTNGVIDFTLELPPGTAAGNNYQIEASFDKTFPTGASYQSGTLTAWKRIFVEKRRMLRNGMLITQPAAAGTSTIQVHGNAYRGNMGRRRLSRGDRIVMVHAPQLDRSDALAGWYLEYHTIDTVQALNDGSGDFTITLGTRQGNTLTPEYLAHPFDKDNIDSAVGDGIARLTGSILSPDDYFDADDALLSGFDSSGKPTVAFSQAFVEYYVLPDSALIGTFIPVPRVLTIDPDIIQDLANRWSTSVAADGVGGNPAMPNHQLLVIGDNDSYNPPGNAGATTKGSEKASIVYRGTIDAQVRQTGVPYTRVDPANYAAKTEAHELTHQWSVDSMWPTSVGNIDEHCPNDSTTFDDPSRYCLMARGDANKSETQVANMVSRFHLRLGPSGAWNSEYFEIRQRTDPFVP